MSENTKGYMSIANISRIQSYRDLTALARPVVAYLVWVIIVMESEDIVAGVHRIGVGANMRKAYSNMTMDFADENIMSLKIDW